MLSGFNQAQVWVTKCVVHAQDPELCFTNSTYIQKKQTANSELSNPWCLGFLSARHSNTSFPAYTLLSELLPKTATLLLHFLGDQLVNKPSVLFHFWKKRKKKKDLDCCCISLKYLCPPGGLACSGQAQKASFAEVLSSGDSCVFVLAYPVSQMTSHPFVAESQDHPQPVASSLSQNSMSVPLTSQSTTRFCKIRRKLVANSAARMCQPVT